MSESSIRFLLYIFITFNSILGISSVENIIGCNGFVKSEIAVDYSQIGIKLYTKQGSLKDHTECAPNNGYYFLPLYDKGGYLLKIDPPKGWTFDPVEVPVNFDGATDLCSLGKDINFHFKGFAVTGKVTSAGSTAGPAGVTLQLLDESGKPKLEVSTGKDGNFIFTPVLPGNYIIKASHSKWMLSKKEVAISVKTGNAVVPANSLVVTGYEVSGSVTSDKEPITGVTFIVFGDKKPEKPLMGCDQSHVSGFSTTSPELKNKLLICHVVSDASGRFSFPCLPSGKYVVIPHYKGAQNIKFDVQPPLLEFAVEHDSVALPTPFQVKGFSVSGRVLWSKDGRPMAKASIYIKNKLVATTQTDGTFHLDSMRAGTYLISVKADDVLFKETEVKVTPKSPVLDDIVPDSYKVCGKVKPSSQSTPVQSRDVQLVAKESGAATTVKVQSAAGDFCTFVAPGVYHASVPVTADEKSKGLQFAPIQREIVVKDSPVSGIEFSQLRAIIRGQVVCLSEQTCSGITVTVASLNGQDHFTTTTAAGGKYRLDNVLPGEYKVSLDRVSDWCWDQSSAPLSVNSANTVGPTFTQTGISITFVSSHNTKILYKSLKKNKGPNEKVPTREMEISTGKSKVCFPDEGEYEIEMAGCHQYIVPKVHWKGGPVVLTAISHAYTGYIITQEPVSDLAITYSTADEARQTPKRLGPLAGVKKDTSKYSYNFSLQLAEGEKVTVTPTAKSLLFSPPSYNIVGGVDCEENGITFDSEKGKIMKGRVLGAANTPLRGAAVTLADLEDNVISSLESGSDGSYMFGPLSAAKKYKLTALKEGYIISGPLDNGDFSAHKMAEVNVEVKDQADNSPLESVLLSLSGGQNYRRNSATGPDGKMNFMSLSLGQYYLRPMMKEYRFDPPSKIINVEEGATVNIVLHGKRVAYSVFGSVTSLSGDAEVGVVVEAVGVGGQHEDCAHLQEESISESTGHFRIRGLQPQTNFKRTKNTSTSQQPFFLRGLHIPSDVLNTSSIANLTNKKYNCDNLSYNISTIIRLLDVVSSSLGKEDPSDSTGFCATSTLNLKYQTIRITPLNHIAFCLRVQVVNKDVDSVRLIVLRKLAQTDVTVLVEADTAEHLRSLKAKLYRDEVVVHSMRLAHLKVTPTFALTSVALALPPLPPDGRTYTLQLESSLSQAAYTYSTQPVRFKADSSFRSARLSFFPQPRTHDSELSHSSYLLVPLLAALTLLFYNRSAALRVLELFNWCVASLAAVREHSARAHHTQDAGLSDSDAALLVEPVGGKRKSKPRKT
ncbi:nodal modulator 1-like [Nilaparvata lugens]|uniref:nodal modulator 1-like n=1 Tax=Nilaparvata lugens TaxID=108931 RepID=UPI00193E9ACC|nr:nodal modulator 1-like [Nilaparvata lugens]